jgi:hypothetical protein
MQVLVGQMASIKSDQKSTANRLNDIATMDFEFALNDESVSELALA